MSAALLLALLLGSTRCQEATFLKRLESESAIDRQRAVEAVSDCKDLSAAALAALVSLPGREISTSDEVSGFGPVTRTSTAMKILIKNAPRSVPFLLAALSDENPDVRRCAAFTLGEMCEVSARTPLEDAIRTELKRLPAIRRQVAVSKQPGIVRTHKRPDDLALFVLKTEVEALARIEPRAAVPLLLGMFSEGQSYENYALNHALAWVVWFNGLAEISDPTSGLSRGMWEKWWLANEGKTDQALFRHGCR